LINLFTYHGVSSEEIAVELSYSKILQPNSTDANALSVIIIAYNEENSIGRCIDSVKKVADEIIVLDSYSTDRTVEIARAKGAIVRQEKFRGYIEQKNRALQLSSHHFVLSLDADEALDQELVNSILAAKKDFRAKAYKMNRCANYCGRFIRHGLWYPDQKVRLFDKRLARWGGANPHDRIELSNRVKVKHLKGNLLHYSYNSIEDHLLQNNHFSTISARTLHEKGVRSHWGKILLNPMWTFIHGYLLRAGFLDGFYGFVIGVNSSHYTFLKYIKLRNLQRTKSRKIIASREESNRA
jgi:glycosyltransferase involved in cell wall biosynthesis